MKVSTTLLTSASAAYGAATGSLWVDKAPSTLKSYAIERYANANALTVGSQTFRFYVTAESSNGTMTILGSNQPYSSSLGVSPHIHERHHENFYGTKGSFALWAEKDDVNEARLFGVGDFGSVPINTTHTYQSLGPDNEIGGVIVPGGFEELFYFLADANVSYPTMSPFQPVAVADTAGAGSSAAFLATLESYDVYVNASFVPRRDFINGTAPSTSTWHDGNNTIPSEAGTPYFIASSWGPKYINEEAGFWQIIQPLITAVTGEGDFTEGTISLSKPKAGRAIPRYTFPDHVALQVQEGSIQVTVKDKTVQLLQGDTVFIKAGDEFSYWGAAAFNKVLYVCSGVNGLDTKLLHRATSWDYAAFPVKFP